MEENWKFAIPIYNFDLITIASFSIYREDNLPDVEGLIFLAPAMPKSALGASNLLKG